jgi:hypothetical protein
MTQTLKVPAILTLFLFSVGAQAFGPTGDDRNTVNRVDGPIPFGDSGVTYRPYADIEKNLEGLVSSNPRISTLVHYGKTIGGRNLTMVRLESKDADLTRRNRPAVEISGAIHGNEYLGIEEALITQFISEPKKMPGLSLFLASGGVVYFIPVVNPDGYEARQRANLNRADLNRDFDVPNGTLKFREPETRQLADYLDRNISDGALKFKFVMDYHCCVPAMIMPWSYVNAHPEAADLLHFNEIAAIQSRLLGFSVGNAMDTVGYNAVGSSLDYYYKKYGAFGFTIEGRYRGEMKALDAHAAFLDQVFEKMALKELGLR